MIGVEGGTLVLTSGLRRAGRVLWCSRLVELAFVLC